MDINATQSCCARCGQVINEVVTINGLPYGTTCAERVLGHSFPDWFKGGDWHSELKKHELRQDELRANYAKSVEITRLAWGDWLKLSKAHLNARKRDNEWEQDFIESIASRLGYFNIISPEKLKYSEWSDSATVELPRLIHEPKPLSSLSDKQLNIVLRILG